MSVNLTPYLTSPASGLTPTGAISPAAAPAAASFFTRTLSPSPAAASYTSPYITLSDSYTPLTPSYAANLRPMGFGATVIIPGPSLPLPYDLDVSRDPRKQLQIARWFRFLTLDKWLYEDMADILNYLKVDNRGVHLIDNLADLSQGPAMDDPQTIEEKINYIEQYILTDDTMKRILRRFVEGTGINWVYLHRNEYYVKEHIRNQLKQILAGTISQRVFRPAI